MKTCTQPDCSKPFLAKGLCSLHYHEQWRKQHPELLAAASKRYFAAHPGLTSRCSKRRVAKNPARYKACTKAYRAKRWDRLFGWESGWCEWIIAVTNTCGLCGKPFGTTQAAGKCIDHDHETNQFRGVIHRRCNTVLAMLGDNKAAVLRALQYFQ